MAFMVGGEGGGRHRDLLLAGDANVNAHSRQSSL